MMNKRRLVRDAVTGDARSMNRDHQNRRKALAFRFGELLQDVAKGGLRELNLVQGPIAERRENKGRKVPGAGLNGRPLAGWPDRLAASGNQGLRCAQCQVRVDDALGHKAFQFGALETGEPLQDAPARGKQCKRLRV